MKWGIHWFRRDLRITGNRALQSALNKYNGRVLGLFCFDAKFLERSDFSHRRFGFFLKTLQKLKEKIEFNGGVFICLNSQIQPGIQNIFRNLKKEFPDSISFSRDYEPFARKRDSDFIDFIHNEFNISVFDYRDHLLIEPHEIQKPDGSLTPYQVYTPFSKQWMRFFETQEVQSRLKGLFSDSCEFHFKWNDYFKIAYSDLDSLDHFIEENKKFVDIDLPEAGEDFARKKLEDFIPKITLYPDQRDFPSLNSTSKLSIYFKNGSLTTSQVLSRVNGIKNQFLKEIIWREFYYYILWHYPNVEWQEFKHNCREINWHKNEIFFEKWTQGETGYPIVDAGMRQLKATGWMHNRVRMIVASFLTKDLCLDWKQGEKFFMNQLLDGDLACNNGGWQWAASTGCDAQPYFRIFNPTLQAKKFDPMGEYILNWLPERRNTSNIHEPFNPIVDHAAQKEKALALFKTK